MKEHDLLRAALGYAAQGLHVIPLKPRDKVPLTAHGGKDATTDPAQIRAWWTQWPDANIGIATGKVSGFWVLDLDGAYPDTWPPLGIEPTVKTARGVHYYFRCPEGTEIKNRAKIGGEQIDVRGDGGYVIAPPSIHPSGVRYEFILS